MKKQPNKTVIRKQPVAGQFTTIPNSILNDKRLSPVAFRILVSVLSDSDNFNLTYQLIQNRFNLSENTVRVAFKLLIKCGYMRIDSDTLKRGNYYIISEYGNLYTGESVDLAPKSEQDQNDSAIKTQNNIEKNEKLFSEYVQSIIEFLDIDEVYNALIELQEKYTEPNGFIDFYQIKSKLDKIIIKFKKKLYQLCMEITQLKSGNAPKKAIEIYSDWVKEQIFNLNKIDFDFERKWLHIKTQNKTFKTDFETASADKREQDYYDRY